jgi:hypothetical protein
VYILNIAGDAETETEDEKMNSILRKIRNLGIGNTINIKGFDVQKIRVDGIVQVIISADGFASTGLTSEAAAAHIAAC